MIADPGVDRITELLAELALQQTGQPCACGCGAMVDPDGPSFYFATDSCQHRWHDENVDDPDDVYRRPDAAHYGAEAFLRDTPRPARAGPDVRLTDAGPVRLPSCPNPRGAAYRRRCGHCHLDVIPQPIITQQGLLHECPGCHRDIGGPAYLADVTEERGRLTLELADGRIRVRRHINLRELARYTDPAGLIDYVWHVMERQMARFDRAWAGTRETARLEALVAHRYTYQRRR